MKRLGKLAQVWKLWKLARLRMEIEIQEGLLRMARTEYARLNALEGKALTLRYGSESGADLAAFEADRAAWTEQVTRLFEEAELSRSAAA